GERAILAGETHIALAPETPADFNVLGHSIAALPILDPPDTSLFRAHSSGDNSGARGQQHAPIGDQIQSSPLIREHDGVTNRKAGHTTHAELDPTCCGGECSE